MNQEDEFMISDEEMELLKREWESREFPTPEEIEAELQKEMEKELELLAFEEEMFREQERIHMAQDPELDLHHPYDDLFHEEEDFDC